MTIESIPKVPQRYFGLLGNLPDVDPSFFLRSVQRLKDLYGPIYQLDLPGRTTIIVSSYELANEIYNDDRFRKGIVGATVELRKFIKDGLFSAHDTEMNWGKAHRILMPVFGPLSVRKMFDQQLDIASQMILKWDRYGPDHAILCNDDFTRLAFDTISLCSFNHRFNDFYTDEMHPFADQMGDALLEAGRRSNRTTIETRLRVLSERKFFADVAAMHKLCDDIVDERIRNPRPEINDLLNVMLNAKDPQTGEGLDRENIRYQMATFLVAGHETTGGTLTFLIYHWMKNPETFFKAQKEVDEVLGDDALTIEHLPKLKYVDASVKETLRWMGPLQILNREAKEPTTIGGKYHVDPSMNLVMNLAGIHHDPKVWGDDHNEFKPERMLDMSNIPAGAWRPFGVGMRSCIGRAFAEQEILINAALILQRFQVTMVDPSYELLLKPTLTIKPRDFEIRVQRRPGKSEMVGLQGRMGHEEQKTQEVKTGQVTGKSLHILYGSNAGTCKSYAEELATNAEALGYTSTIQTLDSAVELQPSGPVAIITPSYEGRPADNARKFVSWLEEGSDDSRKLKNFEYSVLGVGNSEWAATFHKIPKLIDDLLPKLGAKKITDIGLVDVRSDAVGPWDDWRQAFLGKLSGKSTGDLTASAGLDIEIEPADAKTSATQSGPRIATVSQNVQLADASCGSAKMHMEVDLPPDSYYQSGDYLVVYPYNHREDCQRVLSRFKISGSSKIKLTNTKKAFLRTDGPETISSFIASRIELGTPVTQRQLKRLAEAAADESSKQKLESMAEDATFEKEILKKRYSILDILEEAPGCKLSFAEYLDMLQPLSPRQYSISSSPLAAEDSGRAGDMTASITYDVHEAPAFSNKNRTFRGVASSYLAGLKPGNQIRCSVRPTNGSFHLPSDSETPVIMICAGTGVAPMHGFVQERAAMAHAGSGKKLGPALLYFGCRDYNSDYLYRDGFEDWEKLGVVSARPCFSQRGPADAQNIYKHTDDRLWAEREEVAKLFVDGAKLLICGSASKVAKSTAEVCKKIWLEKHADKTEADAAEWLETIREVRYVSDVFA